MKKTIFTLAFIFTIIAITYAKEPVIFYQQDKSCSGYSTPCQHKPTSEFPDDIDVVVQCMSCGNRDCKYTSDMLGCDGAPVTDPGIPAFDVNNMNNINNMVRAGIDNGTLGDNGSQVYHFYNVDGSLMVEYQAEWNTDGNILSVKVERLTPTLSTAD